jgi:hypothetical protein
VFDLEKTYHLQSLPVLKQIQSMRKNWGNENSSPDCEIRDHEKVYYSLMESGMALDNNKKIHKDV